MIKEPSNLDAVLKYESVHSMKWKKWLTDEVDMSDLDNLDEQTTLQITELCGHYTYSKPKVALEINKLYEC